MNRRLASAAIPLALAAALLPAAARADAAIDGDWCSIDGIRTMTINGPAIVTPDGSRLSGEYQGHFFRYDVPTDKPRAGGSIAMIMVDDDTLRLTNAGNQWSARHTAGEIWHRCDTTLSSAGGADTP